MPVSRWALPVVAFAGAALGASAMYVASTARAGTDVRAQLLANPEMIPEAMQKLQDRESGKLVAAHRGAIVRPYAGAWMGNADGDVSVIQYFDYNCGYCRTSLPVLQQLVAADANVRIVFRELPILAQSSRDAARVSLAAARAGSPAYQRFHTALYAAGPVSNATIAAAARAAGVDPAAVPADAEQEIERNRELSSTLGLNGTPAWVIGDRVLSGAQSLEALQDAVRAARGS